MQTENFQHPLLEKQTISAFYSFYTCPCHCELSRQFTEENIPRSNAKEHSFFFDDDWC